MKHPISMPKLAKVDPKRGGGGLEDESPHQNVIKNLLIKVF